MTDITKILEQEFADSGGVVGKAYLLDAKAEIERLRGLSDITRLDVMWQELVKERYAAENNAAVLAAEVKNLRAEVERLRAERDAYSNEITGTLMPELDRLRHWEARAVKSMDAASKAAGVEVCDQIPEEIERLCKAHNAVWDTLRKTAKESHDEIERLRDQIEHMFVAIVNSGSMQFAYKQKQEIKRLRGALDAVTTVEGNIMELERKATQRGARMQIMRESMSPHSWNVFCKFHSEAVEWFDEDGVPK